MKRVTAGFLCVVATLSTVAIGCGGDGDSGSAAAEGGTQKAELLLAFPKSILWTPLLVAEDRGYFADEGLDVSVTETEGTSFVMQQIVAGNADFGWAVAPGIVIAAAKDPSLRAVACTHQRNLFDLAVPEGSSITSVEQLRGKEIGITVKGGGEEPLIRAILEERGMTDDVDVLPLGAVGPQFIEAIRNDQVDAFAVAFGDVTALQAAGIEWRSLTPPKYAGMPGGCLAVKEQTLDDPDKRAALVKIVRGWSKGAVFAQTNDDAALKIACAAVPEECQNRDRFAEPFLASTVELLTPLDEAQPPASIDPAGWRVPAVVLATAGVIDEKPAIETLVADPKVQELQREAQDYDRSEVEQEAKTFASGS